MLLTYALNPLPPVKKRIRKPPSPYYFNGWQTLMEHGVRVVVLLPPLLAVGGEQNSMGKAIVWRRAQPAWEVEVQA